MLGRGLASGMFESPMVEICAYISHGYMFICISLNVPAVILMCSVREEERGMGSMLLPRFHHYPVHVCLDLRGP